MSAIKDLTACSFGRLTVRHRVENIRREAAWLCQCACGNLTTVAGYSLRSGATGSCGCIQKEKASATIGQAAAVAHANRIKPASKISYRSAHRRVERAKGLASLHSCVDCGSPARDWSLRHDAVETHVGENNNGSSCLFSGDPNDYDPRCKKCHAAYDRSE